MNPIFSLKTQVASYIELSKAPDTEKEVLDIKKSRITGIIEQLVGEKPEFQTIQRKWENLSSREGRIQNEELADFEKEIQAIYARSVLIQVRQYEEASKPPISTKDREYDFFQTILDESKVEQPFYQAACFLGLALFEDGACSRIKDAIKEGTLQPDQFLVALLLFVNYNKMPLREQPELLKLDTKVLDKLEAFDIDNLEIIEKYVFDNPEDKLDKILKRLGLSNFFAREEVTELMQAIYNMDNADYSRAQNLQEKFRRNDFQNEEQVIAELNALERLSEHDAFDLIMAWRESAVPLNLEVLDKISTPQTPEVKSCAIYFFLQREIFDGKSKKDKDFQAIESKIDSPIARQTLNEEQRNQLLLDCLRLATPTHEKIQERLLVRLNNVAPELKAYSQCLGYRDKGKDQGLLNFINQYSGPHKDWLIKSFAPVLAEKYPFWAIEYFTFNLEIAGDIIALKELVATLVNRKRAIKVSEPFHQERLVQFLEALALYSDSRGLVLEATRLLPDKCKALQDLLQKDNASFLILLGKRDPKAVIDLLNRQFLDVGTIIQNLSINTDLPADLKESLLEAFFDDLYRKNESGLLKQFITSCEEDSELDTFVVESYWRYAELLAKDHPLWLLQNLPFIDTGFRSEDLAQVLSLVLENLKPGAITSEDTATLSQIDSFIGFLVLEKPYHSLALELLKLIPEDYKDLLDVLSEAGVFSTLASQDPRYVIDRLAPINVELRQKLFQDVEGNELLTEGEKLHVIYELNLVEPAETQFSIEEGSSSTKRGREEVISPHPTPPKKRRN